MSLDVLSDLTHVLWLHPSKLLLWSMSTWLKAITFHILMKPATVPYFLIKAKVPTWLSNTSLCLQLCLLRTKGQTILRHFIWAEFTFSPWSHLKATCLDWQLAEKRFVGNGVPNYPCFNRSFCVLTAEQTLDWVRWTNLLLCRPPPLLHISTDSWLCRLWGVGEDTQTLVLYPQCVAM